MSQKTRELMAWHTFCDLSYGLWSWLVLLLASLVCVLGIDGCHDTFFRCATTRLAVVPPFMPAVDTADRQICRDLDFSLHCVQ